MKSRKEIWIIGFALFSMFFGAGNSILPPFLGFKAGADWIWVMIGFVLTATVIPILGIVAHAKLQGTMFDFGKKVSPFFSGVYCIIVYLIAITLPGPRTASVTHEMAIVPLVDSSSLLTSCIYFLLVFICVMNRSRIVGFLGKYLAPLLGITLLAIIGIGLLTAPDSFSPRQFENPMASGLLEGYQTFDALGAMLAGGILIISLNMNRSYTLAVKKELIYKAGLIAGLGLFVMYGGMIWIGAKYSTVFPDDITRSSLLTAISFETLGNIGQIGLSILVGLACFTTAVSIVIGTADYSRSLFRNSKHIYYITAAISCLLGIVIGQFDVHYIIDIAMPVLMFIYPLTIVLIILNAIPAKRTSARVFKIVAGVTFLFSIPDFLKFIIEPSWLIKLQQWIPFSAEGLGWVLPALLSYLVVNAYEKISSSNF